MPAVILNVATQPAARSSRSQMLRAAGYIVREAASGAEALDLISRESPIAVVLDVAVSGIDGFELCRRIKQHSCIRSPRVLHMTTSGNWQTDYERSSASGADACLAEPLGAAIFRHTLEWLIGAPCFPQASAAEDLSRLQLEALPELLWTCRSDGWCDHLGRQWVEYTGVPEARQLGFGWLEAIHPDERENLGRAWTAAIANRGLASIPQTANRDCLQFPPLELAGCPGLRNHSNFNFEARIRRHDGAYRWFQFRGVAIRDSTGAVARWACSCADIEARKQAEEALRRAAERLKSIDEELRRLREMVALAYSETSAEPLSLGATTSP